MPFITTVTLVASASDVQFDDIRFGTTYADVSPVPEPSGLVLGVAAFVAGIGCKAGGSRADV